jgi:large subunit ribosomal protein L23
MKIKEIFKKKKGEEKGEKSKPKEEKKAVKEEKAKEALKKEEKPREERAEKKPSSDFLKRTKKGEKIAPFVLLSPHIAEKPTRLAELNQYVFKVYPKANKPLVKRAVEEVYGVEVVKVRIVNIPSKRRRLGRTVGRKKGYKKAIVTVKAGQKIEILPR